MDQSATASTFRPVGLPDDPRGITAFWLSDPKARGVLNSQLAEILRTILEPTSLAEPASALHCPLCSGNLFEYEQDDIWVRGLKCPAEHCWSQRGGRLAAILASGHFTLHSEIPESSIDSLLQWWLKGDPHLESNLHESVRSVIQHEIRSRAAQQGVEPDVE
jgi:hypothetical protein